MSAHLGSESRRRANLFNQSQFQDYRGSSDDAIVVKTILKRCPRVDPTRMTDGRRASERNSNENMNSVGAHEAAVSRELRATLLFRTAFCHGVVEVMQTPKNPEGNFRGQDPNRSGTTAMMSWQSRFSGEARRHWQSELCVVSRLILHMCE